ncbi:hypothetical protein PV04_05410 [Phialophora macrospora]|uniref:Ketoreductase domain-containing protein n=1 Tax=Phialophora macrospora TaxID=1851006 RepID=A0A0D2E5D8_9EURO|nr:hypothetical protein PV04_05410 [Phialophora macrospora]
METFDAKSDAYKRRSVRDLLSLHGKTIVVTGGGRGLGLAFARGCAEVGANIAILDLHIAPEEDLDSLSSQLGVKAEYFRVDITDHQGLKDVFDSIKQNFGSIDGLINAAGVAIARSFLEHSLDEIQKTLGVNVIGTMTATQLAVRQMIAQQTGGSIVNIASIAGHKSMKGQENVAAYSASKAAVLGFTRAIAVELASKNIRVNSISPGYFLTEMSPGYAEKNWDKLRGFEVTVPMGRFADRGELKSLAAFLMSPAASYMTGEDIVVDGGILA